MPKVGKGKVALGFSEPIPCACCREQIPSHPRLWFSGSIKEAGVWGHRRNLIIGRAKNIVPISYGRIEHSNFLVLFREHLTFI